jgi:hypothetical protein
MQVYITIKVYSRKPLMCSNSNLWQTAMTSKVRNDYDTYHINKLITVKMTIKNLSGHCMLGIPVDRCGNVDDVVMHLRLAVVFLSPSRQMPGYYFEEVPLLPSNSLGTKRPTIQWGLYSLRC